MKLLTLGGVLVVLGAVACGSADTLADDGANDQSSPLVGDAAASVLPGPTLEPDAAAPIQALPGPILEPDAAAPTQVSTTLATVAVKKQGAGMKSCLAGPQGVGLPNRFVSCYCEQLKQDCSDAACGTCGLATRVDCDQTSWFAGINPFNLACDVDEEAECGRFCRASAKCATGCAAP